MEASQIKSKLATSSPCRGRRRSLGLIAPLLAATTLWLLPPTDAAAQGTRAVVSCGLQSFATTGAASLDNRYSILATGELCITGSLSANLGGFHWESALTPLAVTTTSASSGTFTAGKVAVVDNVGTTNDIFCRLGPTATTAMKPIKPGTWMAFQSTSETVISCITSSSTSTANIQIGTGLATGAGGSGSGGGGGGAATIADGADVVNGATTDAVVAAGAAGTHAAKFRRMTTDLGTIATNTTGGATAANQSTGNTSLSNIDGDLGAAASSVCGTATGNCDLIALIKYLNNAAIASTPAGTNIIGRVGIDQTTPGNTNGVQVVRPLDNSSVSINISTATTTQLVALSGTTLIYVTSYDVVAGGTGNITFVYGTGTNCGTGTTSLTGPYNLTAQAGIAKGSGIGTVLRVPAGNALCATTSAAVQMSGSISYQQF